MFASRLSALLTPGEYDDTAISAPLALQNRPINPAAHDPFTLRLRLSQSNEARLGLVSEALRCNQDYSRGRTLIKWSQVPGRFGGVARRCHGVADSARDKACTCLLGVRAGRSRRFTQPTWSGVSLVGYNAQSPQSSFDCNAHALFDRQKFPIPAFTDEGSRGTRPVPHGTHTGEATALRIAIRNTPSCLTPIFAKTYKGVSRDRG